MFGWLPGGQPRMGPAPANPTARRDGRGGAPNPLLGWWFGCPGAGPIRACHRACSPATVLTNECQFANRLGRERGPENGYPDRRPPNHRRNLKVQNATMPVPWDADELRLTGDYFALADGEVGALRPTLADHRFGCVAVAASMRCLAGCRVGNREWGLRPQTPPPTEMGVVARQTRCWAGGLGVRAQAPFALAPEMAGQPRR